MTPWAPELILPAEQVLSAEWGEVHVALLYTVDFLTFPDHAPPQT